MLSTVNGQYDYRVASDAEIDGVGKSTEHSALRFAMNAGKRRRCLRNPRNQRFQGFAELFAQTDTA